MSNTPGARLDGIEGQGYAVLESLPTVGKGRRLTGLFQGPLQAEARFREALEEARRVEFRGTVHDRQRTYEDRVSVDLVRVGREDGQLLVEFAREGITGPRS